MPVLRHYKRYGWFCFHKSEARLVLSCFISWESDTYWHSTGEIFLVDSCDILRFFKPKRELRVEERHAGWLLVTVVGGRG